MRRSLIGLGLVGVIVVVIAWALRGTLRETWFAASQPELPPAQSFRSSTNTVPGDAATSSAAVATSSRTVKPVATSSAPVVRPTASSTAPTPAPVDELPETVNLAVPFLSQAPKQNWEMPYQEACEEASMIMVDAYLRGRTKAYVPEEGDDAILKLVAYEESQGLKPDLTAAEVEDVITGYFTQRRVEQVSNPTVDDMKRFLAAGYPIIIPASGKALKNPNFRNGGPNYHMLVVKGYLKDGRWITNDPGTRRGADYLYGQTLLMDAIHDWNGGDVVNGASVILVVKPR